MRQLVLNTLLCLAEHENEALGDWSTAFIIFKRLLRVISDNGVNDMWVSLLSDALLIFFFYDYLSPEWNIENIKK